MVPIGPIFYFLRDRYERLTLSPGEYRKRQQERQATALVGCGIFLVILVGVPLAIITNFERGGAPAQEFTPPRAIINPTPAQAFTPPRAIINPTQPRAAHDGTEYHRSPERRASQQQSKYDDPVDPLGNLGLLSKRPHSGVYRVGGGVTAPVLLNKIEPTYSEEARQAKHEGTVLLYVEVSPNGRATNIKVARSQGLGLDEKAIEAVKQWEFKPGYKNGQPVTVAATIEVNFHLL